MDLLQRISQKLAQKNPQIAEFSTGDTVNVYVKVKEGEKERIQVYKGLVTKIQGRGHSRSFTVRKISAGVGVERTFPISSPSLEKVDLVSHGRVRRSRLFFLRKLEGKAAKINSELASPESSASAAAKSEAKTEVKAEA